jgi:hypothetical protein
MQDVNETNEMIRRAEEQGELVGWLRTHPGFSPTSPTLPECIQRFPTLDRLQVDAAIRQVRAEKNQETADTKATGKIPTHVPASPPTPNSEERSRQPGRKRKADSRATEIRERLIAWQETLKSERPSLRALAAELGISHQLLLHYYEGLEKWREGEDLKRLRATAKAKNVVLTPAAEKRHKAWLKKVRKRQAREREKYLPRERKLERLIEARGGLDAMMKALVQRLDQRLKR